MPSVQARFAHTTSSRFQVEGSSSAPVLLMVSGGADSSALTLLAATSQLDLEDGRGCAPIAKERLHILHVNHGPVSYTHLTLPTMVEMCRSRWSPYH